MATSFNRAASNDIGIPKGYLQDAWSNDAMNVVEQAEDVIELSQTRRNCILLRSFREGSGILREMGFRDKCNTMNAASSYKKDITCKVVTKSASIAIHRCNRARWNLFELHTIMMYMCTQRSRTLHPC